MLEFLIHLLTRYLLTRSQIIITAVNNHLLGMIRINNIAGIPDHIIQRRTAKPPIDHRISRKIGLNVRPFPKGTTSDKKYRVGRRAMQTILMLEFGNPMPERRSRLREKMLKRRKN